MPREYPLTILEKKAWKFAEEAHRGVVRKFTGVPYFEHVRKVFKLVKKYDSSELLGACALLHDVVEDTEYTYDDIENEFGIEVANIVKELTSKDEMIKTMGKPEYLLDKMSTMSDGALLVKLCDRLQNLSDHFNASDKFRDKYYSETKYIMDSLRNYRQLTAPQIGVFNLINGILDMMPSRYKITKYENFKN